MASHLMRGREPAVSQEKEHLGHITPAVADDPLSEMEWSPYPVKKTTAELLAGTSATAAGVHSLSPCVLPLMGAMLHGGTGDNESERTHCGVETDEDEDEDGSVELIDYDGAENDAGQCSRLGASAKRPGEVVSFRRRGEAKAKRHNDGRLYPEARTTFLNDDHCACCHETARLQLVIESMPHEAWLRIICHLGDVRDVELSVALVCHRFLQITRENLLWKKLSKQKWGPFLKWIGPRRWTAGFDWRQYYMQRSLIEKPNSMQWEYPTIQGPKPSPRFVQTATPFGASEIVFIGGKQNEESRLDEIHILDVNTMNFREPSIRGDPVPPIARHTATVIGNRVFIIGGYGSTYFHDLSMLDLATMTWSAPTTYGKRPRHRSNHAAVAIGTDIYMFGGSTDDEDGNYVTLGDFFVLNTQTFEWTQLTPENCSGPFPEGRAGHRMVAIRDRLFLFGGGVWDKSRRSWLAKINTTHVFDPLTRTWIKPQMRDNILPDTCTFTSIFNVGVFMFACFGQSMRQFTVNDHVYVLDTIAMEWRRVYPDGVVQPLARDMASATVVANRVYFMGGNCAGLLVDHNFCALAFPPTLKH